MKPPKFRVGQIVVMTNSKKETPFRIIDMSATDEEFFYAFNRNNYVAESSIRSVRNDEI